jgi:hypothetical protein
LKSPANSEKHTGYVKPELVVYGDFSKLTRLTGSRPPAEAVQRRTTPLGDLSLDS